MKSHETAADYRHQSFSSALLAWYDSHRRRLPWRYDPGTPPDPYRVWLSEIMLQQTTVVTVIPYFEKFTKLWPTVHALADAPLDDILLAWAGLGYYARARNLHKCAKEVVDRFGGMFPSHEDDLRSLPGIGAYTAAAVSSIAFGQPSTPVDGNIQRVMARLHGVATPLPDAKKELASIAAVYTPEKRPGDYAQALMDLGATICTPRNPQCLICPCHTLCDAAQNGDAESLPKKRPKPQKPTRYGRLFWLEWPEGDVLIRRRPESGLLGGLWEIPSTEWSTEKRSDMEAPCVLGISVPKTIVWSRAEGVVKHTFTHFHLELEIYRGVARRGKKPKGHWVDIHQLDQFALPTVMKKVVRAVLVHKNATAAKKPRVKAS